MKVTIDIATGPKSSPIVTKQDIQKNIDALQRTISGKVAFSDITLLLDTKSILIGIQQALPDK